MRIRRFFVMMVAILLGSALASAVAQTNYYLALGDSLAIGVQPTGSGDAATNQGYADDLFAFLSTRTSGLALAKLGCSGETTITMINGGICTYTTGSQLGDAVAFIQTHPVTLITIDIGANDIDHCVSTSGIDTTCVATALANVGTYLPQILAALRAAAGPHVPIIGMNYYDPFLAAWTLGAAGQKLAKATVKVADTFNTALHTVYEGLSIPMAQVAYAFRTNDFTLIPGINLPVNVSLILAWTWMGAPAPFGPDVHPNVLGYAIIAGAFAEKVPLH